MPTTIIGVDYSGADSDSTIGKTWVTKGRFDGEALTIEERYPRPVSRVELEQLLRNLPVRSVVAMDFPFSVPIAFAESVGHSQSEMPALWNAAASMSLDEFKRKSIHYSELLRVGDLAYPNVQPCLRYLPPTIMVNMTFSGMQMLDKLWKTGKFEILPLKPKKLDDQLPVLLEVMPGLALKFFGLPYRRYKDGNGATERQYRRKMRCKILKDLEVGSGVKLSTLGDSWEKCVDDRGGDALDSLVASIVAARWAKSESDFLHPTNKIVDKLKRNARNKRQASQQALGMTECQSARQEGWIYLPKPNHRGE